MRVGPSVRLALTVSVGGAVAQTPPPVNLAFATLDTGSAWYVYGATMAELLRKTLPPGSNIDVKPRSGGVGNPRLVAKNETPLGFAFTVTNRWAYEGKEAYDAKLENLRGLVGGLDTYYLVAIASRKHATASSNCITVRRARPRLLMAVARPIRCVRSAGSRATRFLAISIAEATASMPLLDYRNSLCARFVSVYSSPAKLKKSRLPCD